MTKFLLATVLALSVAACATHEPVVPVDYTGPTATISDHGFAEDGSKGQIFYVAEIDGKTVPNQRSTTAQASFGRGFSLTLGRAERVVPARPLRLKLVGTHVTAAPVHEMASRMAGTFFEVEGEVVFTPLPGHAYFVTGRLDKGGSSVWLADAADEKTPVSDIVRGAVR